MVFKFSNDFRELDGRNRQETTEGPGAGTKQVQQTRLRQRLFTSHDLTKTGTCPPGRPDWIANAAARRGRRTSQQVAQGFAGSRKLQTILNARPRIYLR